jgi:ribulose-5-phosphate 4-epimerase/fuculose-1-phosphate aldolase
VNLQRSTEELNSKTAETVAVACRLLARLGLVREKTGHVSARAGDGNAMLLRCRTEGEAGLAFTTADMVKTLSFEGASLDERAASPPNEWPIHSELYKARADVGAVVHAHPPACLIVSLVGIELLPVVGAYDSSVMRLGLEGVPTYGRSIVIDTPELAREVAETMTGKAASLLRGHGVVTVGKTVEEATLTAIRLENLAQIHLDIVRAGGKPEAISEEDINYMMKARARASAEGGQHMEKVASWTWNHYVKSLL